MSLFPPPSDPPRPSLPMPGGPRWQVLRAGLQNIWEYDDQRFVFHHGRLLLRGRNESGKTKALELLFPFLLDADLAPQRLDPFGSTSRPMRWNLINEYNPEVSVSIGYAWLELGRQSESGAETFTLGAGLRAKRQNPAVDSWYFTTAQRIDDDLHLFDGSRVPLTRTALEEAIGSSGRVFEGKTEYRQSVNQRLFGMSDDQYAALLDALLQLRRPQLSKQLEPEQLSEILTASLPPLEGRAVAPLAEGFERLDRHRAEREELEATLAALNAFSAVYRVYAAAVAKARAQELTRADSAHQKARAEHRQAQGEEEAAHAQLAFLADVIERLEHEDETLSERIQALRSSEEYQAVERLDEAEKDASAQTRRARQAEDVVGREQQEKDAAARRLQKAEQELGEQAQEVEHHRRRAEAAATSADLEDAHRALEAQIESEDLAAARGTLEGLFGRRLESIRTLTSHHEKVMQAAQAERLTDERCREADARVRGSLDALTEAERAETSAAERFDAEILAWLETLVVLPADLALRARLREAPFEERRGHVDRQADAVARRLEDQRAELGASLRGVRDRIDTTRAEHHGLASATHHPPPPPHWRPARGASRAGAPLYLLCDFAVSEPAMQAAIEAALESAGLLDAWVLPDGIVLDARLEDVVLRPDPRDGPTLADVLVPTEAGPVARDSVERVLRTIALVHEGEEAPDAPAWVAIDGRWQVGPLRGAWRKERAAHIGATAREAARARRLAELAAALADLDQERLALEGALARVQRERVLLGEECLRFPSLDLVRDARAHAAAVGRQLAAERELERQARESQARAASSRRAAEVSRASAAAELRLVAWVDRLDLLKERSEQYRAAVLEWLAEARERASRADLGEELRDASARAAQRCEEARLGAEEAGSEARRAEARAAALREAVGATRDELLATLREAETRQKAARTDLQTSRQGRSEADRRAGLARGQVVAAEHEVAATDERRQAAFRELSQIAGRGLLVFTEASVDLAPEQWTFTDALLLARRIDAAVGGDGSKEAQEKADNRVAERQQELARSLPPEIRLLPERADGVLAYRAVWNGRSLLLPLLLADLSADLEARDRLLGREEAELFESFLSGETHERLRARLREAHELVNKMNAQLAACPTASGMRLRLRWDVAESAPAGARDAIGLLFRAGHLLSDADRGALRDFLRQRLAEARAGDGIGSLQERMLAVLDYRLWFSFEVEFQSQGETWKKLTRKAHGAGSGGQKAVLLHLPLFAAAAAFYASASPAAPRLIVLDEAFAGIDRETRGQLMGLLVELGLDFIMTSYDEWGFYEELDGLSTYHLSRERGMRGVHTDWFLWDGKRSRSMD